MVSIAVLAWLQVASSTFAFLSALLGLGGLCKARKLLRSGAYMRIDGGRADEQSTCSIGHDAGDLSDVVYLLLRSSGSAFFASCVFLASVFGLFASALALTKI